MPQMRMMPVGFSKNLRLMTRIPCGGLWWGSVAPGDGATKPPGEDSWRTPPRGCPASSGAVWGFEKPPGGRVVLLSLDEDRSFTPPQSGSWMWRDYETS